MFFHERKALSQFEKRYASRSQLRPFNVEPMTYTASLQQAITELEQKLAKQDNLHSQISLDNLQRLKKDYSLQYKQNFE